MRRIRSPPGAADRTPRPHSRVPLGGLVVLEWHDEPGVELAPLPTPERLRLIHAQHYAGWISPPEPGGILAMLDVPMWRLRRGRDWDSLPAVLDALRSLA